MHLKTPSLVLLGLLVVTPSKAIDINFLLNYYDQDGEHSPVTGGVGTEDLQVVAPVFVIDWTLSDDWSLKLDFGVDGITSASTDNIDTEVSSASRQDSRAYMTVSASRSWRENQTWRFGASLSNEYDYSSLGGHVGWSIDLDQRNTTLAVGLRYFTDAVVLYDIDGVDQGEADRETTDLSVSLTRVLGRRTVASVELGYTMQSGFLSTPFHEVILAPTLEFPQGQHVTERLPDSRNRLGIGFSLHHSLTSKIVQRVSYRFYDDDWGIRAHTVEAETHFRLPTRNEVWVYPILRFHTQEASDSFGLPGAFDGSESFFTADRDLSEFVSEKFGLGLRWQFRNKKSGFFSRLQSFESRVATYSRDDGFEAVVLLDGFRLEVLMNIVSSHWSRKAPGILLALSLACVGTIDAAEGKGQLIDQLGRSHDLTAADTLTVVDFVAAWCEPCYQALPEIKRLARQYPAVRFLVVSVDEEISGRDRLVEDLGLEMPVIWDAGHELIGKFRPRGFPATYVLGPKGDVLYQHVGFDNEKWQSLVNALSELEER